ncbi:sensor histidine kinase [Filobacillus milosensis]|uniref:sensor histidine kinase n=1 Tax=Filobacillus milosensis TaxID=94137 RepID=UPI001E4B913F|nr:HAMP domain-containing sensor histidine kinase [Filobacillus milosensis]
MRPKIPFIKGLLFNLTLLNVVIITLAIVLSSFAIYQTACLLVDSLGNLNDESQQRFESLLFQYLIMFSLLTIIIGSVLHFYLTRNIIHPIREVIQSTKSLKTGEYPNPVNYTSSNEIGELVHHYNELVEQLKSSNHIRRKMVSDLSHEIRTPISNLNGYLYALKNGDIKQEYEVFNSLYEESQRLKLLIENLDQLKEWDYLKTQKVTIKNPVNIQELINQCVSLFMWKFDQRGISLNINVQQVKINVQKEGIQQVIFNLLENALHYHAGDSPVTISGIKNDKCYEVSITSEGNPIPHEEHSKIFDRFYRLDQNKSMNNRGSGLGLAIVKEIVNQHHGTIGVKTTDQTNQFWFELPIKKQ